MLATSDHSSGGSAGPLIAAGAIANRSIERVLRDEYLAAMNRSERIQKFSFEYTPSLLIKI